MSFKKEKLEKKFADEYKRLNKEQRLAVDNIEGPVMVIAGPGTGKTQILASRIGKILLETDTLPQNILCLTYTDAGVLAMRRRLLEFIGSDAYKVNIHTYHSFCNTVIQENIRYFNKRELEALSELERVQFLKQLIDGFTKDNPLKRYKGEIYYDLKNLSGLFSAIKREGWNEEQLLQKIEEYISVIIPETDGFYMKREKAKGNFQLTQKGREEVERMEKLKAAIKAFKVYQQLLNENHRYDFDDMINWVIDMFQQQENLLRNYQEQFQYILVDEYQDTSGSQNRIVELLISYWQDESPNIFVVGDDDQSIYRFQGANLKNMMNLANKYEQTLVKVVLTQNYRSVQPILDGAKGLIEHNEQRLVNQYKDLHKDLIASNETLKSLNILPVIRVYENEFAENAHVAASIKDLVDRGVNPGHIAIIYKEHKTGDELIKFFQLKEIPFYVKRSVNLLNDVFINQVLNIVRYTVAELDNPNSGEALLFEILHYNFFNIKPFRIASICNEIAEKRNKTLEEGTIRGYLQNLNPATNGTLFSPDSDTDELYRVSRVLENLQKEVYNKSIQHWFEYLVNEAGILAHIMKLENKAWEMSKLSCLFDYIKDSTHRNPELSLKEVMLQIKLLAENDLPLPLVQTTGTESGVNLLTCHGSKGLEFEYVFVINARSDVWEAKRKPNQGFRVPHNVLEQESPAENIEELRRLFFVAVTRAEKYLFISYPNMTNEGKPMEPSQFVEEFRSTLQIEASPVLLTEEEKIHFSSLRFGIIKKPVLAQFENDFITRQLEKFVMNVTALNNYLDCPLKFYYNTLIRVPSAKSEAAEFGSAVHAALSDFLNEMMDNKTYPDKSFLIQHFIFHLRNRREVFSSESLQRFLEHGQTILDKYFEHYYNPAPIGDFIASELSLSKVVVDNIPLKGFTDKVQFWHNDIVITDFKTGSLSKSLKRGDFDLPGSARHPDGGNYWRQAVFYKILIDNLPNKKWKVLHTQFDYVEPNNKNQFDLYRVNITDEHIETVKQQIVKTWHKIQNREFYTGCGKPECVWCNFVKTNKLEIEILETEPVNESV